jgi:hypothetical protein
MKNIKRTCLGCNKTFLADKKEVKRGNAKYCSISCSSASRNKHKEPNIKSVCKHCGVKFNSINVAKYCSDSCKQKNYRLKKKSSNMFDRQLEMLIRNYPCEVCGWDAAPRDTHHIEPVSKGGKTIITNIISLCPNHHRMIHCNLLSQDYLYKIVNSRTISSSLDNLLFKIKSKEQDAKSGN